MSEPKKDISRVGLRVNLTPTAAKIVDNIKTDTGIAKEIAVARVLEWFASLQPQLRSAILAGDIKTRDALVDAMLREMAAAQAQDDQAAATDVIEAARRIGGLARLIEKHPGMGRRAK